MHFQPAHFGFVDLLAEQAGLFVHFLALYPVDRGNWLGDPPLRCWCLFVSLVFRA